MEQALYSLVRRSFTGGGGGGAGGAAAPAVKGPGVGVNNVLMELRSICNHPCIRCVCARLQIQRLIANLVLSKN
jgi:hypothetical protein